MQGSIRERRPGVWELRVFVGRDPVTRRDRYVSETHKGGRKSAQTALAALVTKHSGGRRAATEGTLGRLLDEYMAVHGPGLAPGTRRNYQRYVDQRIKPTLGGLELRKLETHDLDRLYRTLLGEGLSASTVRQVHAVLRVALNQGVRWGWVPVNVAVAATPPRRQRTSVTPPSLEVTRRLLEAATKHSPDLGLALRLAAVTGARRGELAGLRWSDIDRGQAVVTVRRSITFDGGGLVAKDTKTHAERELPLDLVTLRLLEVHRRVSDERAREAGVRVHRNGYVLSRSADGLRPVNPDTLTGEFRRLRKRAKAEGVRFHDLRHAAATLMLDAGVPVKTVQRRLGHASAMTTLDIYGHPVDASDVVAADLLGRLMDGPSEPESPAGALPPE